MADVSIRVGLDVGGLLANSARGVSAIKEIDRAMEEARKKGDYDLYGKMAYEKDRLQTGISGFQQDIKTFSQSGKFQEYNAAMAKGEDVSRFTADHEFMARLKSLDESNKALEQALNGVREAAEKGDFEQIQRGNTAAGQELDRVHQVAGQAGIPGASEAAGQSAAFASFLNVQTAQQVIGALATGIKTYVAHLDRSSIIGQQGSGDIVGAEVSDLRRDAVEKSTFWGSVGRIGGGILGGVIGSLIAPGIGTAAGAALGSTLFGTAGDLAGTGDEAEANRMATKEALAQQWQSQAPAAMELAGILGRYGGSDEENTAALRDVFSRAAGMANEYGYSAAEGMEAVKQGAAQGLGEGDAIAAAKSAFAFERGTGADRASLLELETRAQRFGMDNMIGAAWQGNQASGMSTGQFNEFLRSMQRVFEDGISKGFIRGANEIAGNLTYLAELGGGSTLFQGEEGANVMQSLSSGIAGATSLNSVNDILTYQAAQSVINRWKNGTDEEQEQYRELFNLDPNMAGYEAGNPNQASSWYAATLLMNRGFTPEVFNEQMRNFKTADRGDFDNIIGRIMSQYGMNSGQAGFLYNAWKYNGEATLADYETAMTMQSDTAPTSGSEELNFEKLTQSFISEMQKLGQNEFTVKVKNMPDLIGNMRNEYNGLYFKPADTSEMSPAEALRIREQELEEAKITGNEDAIFTAEMNLHRANQIAMNPDLQKMLNMDEQFFRTQEAFEGLFDFGLTRLNTPWKSAEQKADLSAINGIEGIITDSIYSSAGDPAKLQQVTELLDILTLVPKEARENWNRNDTLNTAFSESKTVGDMLTALQRLITVTEENGKMNVTVRSEEG